MATRPAEFVVAWPTLWIVPDWCESHCFMPSAMVAPSPLELYPWQIWALTNHYRIRPRAVPAGTAKRDGSRVAPASAFVNRRSQIVGTQKAGKSPLAAAFITAEAVGPVVFDGFAVGGEVYRCRDHGCSCGWTYSYEPGEPMGTTWHRPLIQLLATSEDQTDNTFLPLQTMIRSGPLSEQLRVGEGFIRAPNDGRIDPVTSKARSRLGQPITFCIHDESGLYTKGNGLIQVAQTMRRGLAGMGGRALELTNPWDPSENSTAQMTYESVSKDVFKQYRIPPTGLSFGDRADRRKILRFNYAGSLHVDLDAIEGECAELMQTDRAQAERFFGGRLVQGLGTWLPDGLWASREAPRPVPEPGSEVCGGFDGSETDDWTAIRLRTRDGWRFTPTYGPDQRPCYWNPAEWGGSIPRGEVSAAWDEICTRYKVVRVYCDPRDWQSEIGSWALEHGEKVFLEWATYRVVAMHQALVRSVNDLVSGRSTHDLCPMTALHVGNARKIAKPGERYMLGKPAGAYHQKIDLAMADVLAHLAGEEALADGWGAPKTTTNYIYTA